MNLFTFDKSPLVITPMWKDYQDAESFPVASMAMIPVVAPQYAEAHVSSDTTLADLKTLVNIEIDSPDEERRFFDTTRHNPSRRITVSDWQTKRSLILSGYGWGYLPEHSIQEDIKRGYLLPLRVPMLEHKVFNVYAIRSIKHPMGPVSAKLWEHLRLCSLFS